MKNYDHKIIESKWQKLWDKTQLYQADDNSKKPKYYYLVEFPYPSADGLHVGHVRSFTALDIMARQKRMEGFNVLYPMGWDAFGLPTENYAIVNKIAPQIATAKNIATFKRQLKAMGLSFDWSREINTTDPAYYKWTQWIFLQLFKKGLAYQAEIPINWCPHEKIGLANEEVINGKHERCGTTVTKKLLKQWVLKITAYADRLINDLKTVDYLEKIATQQINWIGKSYGSKIIFKTGKYEIPVFTTRIDTLAGATFMILAPEHQLVKKLTTQSQKAAVEKYLAKTMTESDLERQEADRPKTGVWTGANAINPLTGQAIPIWVSDYVLMDYGTGAIMAVPAHDERDFDFAKKYQLDIIQVIDGGKLPYLGEGNLINSGQFNGLSAQKAAIAITQKLAAKKLAQKTVQYKLRDWIFSRQHYWGEPIPIIHCSKCGAVPVSEKDLPVKLPEVKHYEPTETGESPLAAMTEWVNTICPKCNSKAKRETNTMPNWAGSSWYYLRYIDPHNDSVLADPAKLKHWLMVDLYNGGMEHTTLHLLYSRFWHKFLYDQKIVPTPEPYAARRSHGMILGTDGKKKMSKSLGNVINPDDVMHHYGADTLRLYEMFMAPYDEMTPWSDERLAGISRFINRIWNFMQTMLQKQDKQTLTEGFDNTFEVEVDRTTHKTLKKVEADIKRMNFNTMVSALMEYLNFLSEPTTIQKLKLPQHHDLKERTLHAFILMLAPSTPHLAEELWEQLGETQSVHLQAWPKYDPKLIVDELISVAVQVNGKYRATLQVVAGTKQTKLQAIALQDKNVKRHLAGQKILKTIVIPDKIVNFVTK